MEDIRKRNEKHRELVNFYRSSDADTKNNKDIGTHVFEMKHITDKSIEDKDYLFSLIDKYKEALEHICEVETDSYEMDKELMFNIARVALKENQAP